VDYDFANPGRSTNGKAVGHFTALVWNASKKVGCAMNPGCSNKFGAGFRNDAVVCRYSPNGNIIYNGGYSLFEKNVQHPDTCGKSAPVTEATQERHPGVKTFIVGSQGDCSCGSGECQAFYEASGEMSCSSTVESTATVIDGDQEGANWTHTCTCAAPMARSESTEMVMDRTEMAMNRTEMALRTEMGRRTAVL